MKQLVLLTAVILLLSSPDSAIAQKKQAPDKDKTVLATVGKESITYKQLEQAFQKNMNRRNVKLSDIPKDSIIEFLNLYINYRLKVNDALGRGFNKDSAVIDDIEQNRKILAESFYYEKKLTEPYVEQWLARRGKEYKIAIIVTTFSSESDTTEAYKKINDAISSIKDGMTFEQAAETFSDDPETGRLGGVVSNYISAGRVNRTLEDAIYALKKGEYTKDYVRTHFGYFLIKILEEQPRKYYKLRSIILENQSQDVSEEDYKKSLDSLVKLARSGKVPFATLAKEHSLDTKTAPNGGEFSGYYTRSTGVGGSNETLVSSIEDAIYKCKAGEVTDPIQMQNAFYIFKVDSILPIDLVAEREEMKTLYKRLYYNEDKKSLLNRLAKEEYGFAINNSVLAELVAKFDTTKTTLDSAWADGVDKNIRSKSIYTLNKENISVDSFLNTLGTRPEYRGNPLTADGFTRAIDKMIEPKVFDLATKNLEKEYPEFSDLVREFRDGILLFKVEAIEVWDKMKFDSTLARKFYDTTSAELIRPDMYDISEIYSLNETDAKSLYEKLMLDKSQFDKIANESTQRLGMRAKDGHYGLLPSDKNALAKLAKENNLKEGDISAPLSVDQGFSIIKVNKIELSRRKTFEEAIPDIAPRVQDLVQKNLTDAWLDSLRKQYPVKIDSKAISNLK